MVPDEWFEVQHLVYINNGIATFSINVRQSLMLAKQGVVNLL